MSGHTGHCRIPAGHSPPGPKGPLSWAAPLGLHGAGLGVSAKRPPGRGRQEGPQPSLSGRARHLRDTPTAAIAAPQPRRHPPAPHGCPFAASPGHRATAEPCLLIPPAPGLATATSCGRRTRDPLARGTWGRAGGIRRSKRDESQAFKFSKSANKARVTLTGALTPFTPAGFHSPLRGGAGCVLGTGGPRRGASEPCRG